MKKIIMLYLLIPIYAIGYAQPANDEPCGAIAIPVVNTGCEPSTIYSYTNATYSSAIGNTYCIGPNVKDVWYKLTVPSNGEVFVAIAVNAGEYQMAVEFYKSTSCTALSPVSEAVEGFPCLYSNGYSEPSRSYKNLAPGSTAYLRVYQTFPQSPFPNSGSVKICVSNTNGLADDPCGAGYFPVGVADPLGQACKPTQSFTWAGATLTPAVPNPSCLQSMPATDIRDVWFKVKVPSTGKLQINTSSNYDFYTNSSDWNFVVAYTNSNGCSGTFTEIGCVMSWTSTPLTWSTLTPGTDVYIRLFKYFSANYAGNGNAKICAEILNSLPGVDNTKKIGIGIDTPFAKLDVVGTGIFRDKLMAASDVEVRGNLIVKGNIVGKYGTAVLQGNTTIQGGPLKIDSLDLGSRLGNRIALFGGLGNVPQYGLGIQNNLLQIYSGITSADIAFGSGNSNSFSEVMRVKGNGLVGIGTSLPSGRLDVVGGSAWFRGTSNISHLNLGTTEDTYIRGGKAGSKVFINDIASPGSVYIGSNVGIGNTIPDAPLSFANAIGNKIAFYSSGVSSQYGIGIQSGLLQMYTDGIAADIAFGTGGSASFTERMRIKGNGNVGIGNNNPVKPLSFPASLGEKILLYPGGTGEVGIGVYGNELRLHADNPGAKISFGTQDNAGVFTENALAQRNGAYAFSILGSLWVNGTTYASDERFKQNISPIQSPLQKLLQLNGVEYEMKTNEFLKYHFQPGRQMGLLAQNVEKIAPEAVSEMDGYKGVDYARLVPLLIESIKALKLELDELKNRINHQ